MNCVVYFVTIFFVKYLPMLIFMRYGNNMEYDEFAWNTTNYPNNVSMFFFL